MQFDPRGFLELASKIRAGPRPWGPAGIRAAVSRCYYSAVDGLAPAGTHAPAQSSGPAAACALRLSAPCCRGAAAPAKGWATAWPTRANCALRQALIPRRASRRTILPTPAAWRACSTAILPATSILGGPLARPAASCAAGTAAGACLTGPARLFFRCGTPMPQPQSPWQSAAKSPAGR